MINYLMNKITLNIHNISTAVEFTTKDSSRIREIISPHNSSIIRQSLAQARLEPSHMTIAHSHPNTEEIYFILSGNGEMAIDTERKMVGQGDAIGIVAGAKHQIRNTGSEDLVFLCMCAPAYSDNDTVMCSNLLEPDQTADREI